MNFYSVILLCFSSVFSFIKTGWGKITAFLPSIQNFKKKVMVEKPGVAHPPVSQIIHRIVSKIQEFRLQKKKTIKKAFFLYLQTQITLEYLLVYFFTYNVLGRTIIFVSTYAFISQVEPFKLFLCCFMISVFFVALSVSFYVQMQFWIYRHLLIEIIGERVFSDYVGFNTSKRQLMHGLYLLGGAVFLGGIGGGLNAAIDVVHKQSAANSYLKSCEAGKLIPDLEVINEIYTKKNNSFYQKLLEGIKNANE